ncbi:MAG: hypothetical protein ACE15B_15105 [Bryobacteraceae bacterium]
MHHPGKNTAIWAAALLLSAASQAQETPLGSRARAFARQTFGPGAWLRAGAGAGFNQLCGRPYEWGGGTDGAARRFASGFGQQAVKASIQFGVGAWRHEAPAYAPSRRSGWWNRARHAIAYTIMTPREGDRDDSIAAGRLAGAFGSGMISRLWQPERLHTAGSGLASGAISLGLDACMNAFREFWPDLRRKLRGNRRPRP